MRPRPVSTAVTMCLLASAACSLPRRTSAQAAAFAGPVSANQVSANPFASPSPAPVPVPCSTFVTRSPWGVPALLFGESPGLLTADNSTYSDATLCCGGVLDFTWTRPHGIWQLAQRACPATFASNPAAGQLQLHPVTDNGTAVLSFDVPGTYFISSPANTDCAQGMLFAVIVPNDPTNKLCTTTAGGPTASATGTPGGTSTSTSQNSAPSASGPPGSQTTLTGDGFAFSSAG